MHVFEYSRTEQLTTSGRGFVVVIIVDGFAAESVDGFAAESVKQLPVEPWNVGPTRTFSK